MTEEQPAWWQLKKPIIPFEVVNIILIICIIGLVACGLVFFANAIYEHRQSSKKPQEIPMDEPKIKGKETLPAIYAFISTLVLLGLLRFFNVTEFKKDDIHEKIN